MYKVIASPGVLPGTGFVPLQLKKTPQSELTDRADAPGATQRRQRGSKHADLLENFTR